MMVVFKEDAASNPADLTFLDRIIHRIEDGAHEWSIENPASLEASDWMHNCRPNLLELFKDAVKKQSYPRQRFPLRSVTVTANPKAGELTPQQAARYVSKPLFVLVENRFSDGELLSTALRYMSPAPLQKLLNSNVHDLIYCDSAGGNGELLKLIRDYDATAKRGSLPLRMVVFTDSDGLLPGYIGDKPKEIESACKLLGVPCLILQKRAIENYIPDEILELCDKEHQSQVAILCQLTREQRDYFPIKDGVKYFARLTKEEIAFYASIDRGAQQTLGIGLGNKVILLLGKHKNVLTAQALQKRDYNGELKKLVQMIVNEL